MKKIIITYSIFLISCGSDGQKEINMETINNLNNVLENNSKNFYLTKEINSKTDSVITDKVDKTINTINELKTEVKQLKIENNELKEKLSNINDDNGKPFRILPISNN